MANIRNGNTFFIDSNGASSSPDAVGNLTLPGVKVAHVTVSSGSGAGQVEVRDISTDDPNDNKKYTFKLDGPNLTQMFDFRENPISFPRGIYPVNVTSGFTATLLIIESGRN